jgi:hypothetical protein
MDEPVALLIDGSEAVMILALVSSACTEIAKTTPKGDMLTRMKDLRDRLVEIQVK